MSRPSSSMGAEPATPGRERVLIGCADPDAAAEIRTVVEALGQYVVSEAVTDPETALSEISSQRGIAAVVLDLTLGCELAPAISRDVGTVLVADDPPARDLLSAFAARVIDVLETPLSQEDLRRALADAVAKTRSRPRPRGTSVVVAGAKGGCGTTTVAVHLADRLLSGGKRVCVVEFGRPAGGVRALLRLSPDDAPVLADLLAGGDGISDEQLVQALDSGGSGLDIIRGPAAEDGAAPDRGMVGKLLWRLKSRYDVVVVDAGVMSSLDALRTPAERVLLVVTPAWQSVAAASDLLSTSKSDVVKAFDIEPLIVLNRSDRTDDIRPAEVREHLRADVAAVMPACFSELQRAAFKGTPNAIRNEDWNSAIAKLIAELGLNA